MSREITKEYLLKGILDFIAKFNRDPKAHEIAKFLDVGRDLFPHKFGSLKKACELARIKKDLPTNPQREIIPGNVFEMNPKSETPSKQENADIEKQILVHLKHPCTVESLCEVLDRSPNTIRSIIEKLICKGYAIQTDDNQLSLAKELDLNDAGKTHNIYNWTEGSHSIGIVSDTHIQSREFQHEFLCSFYEYANQRDVELFIHCGDLTDGPVRKHQRDYDVGLHSSDETVDWIVENYPRPKNNQKTLIVAGNHDNWWYENTGLDIIKSICVARPDMINLGFVDAWIVGPNGDEFFIHAFHPFDGSAYAKSYKSQKTSEHLATTKTEQLPKINLEGNYHKFNYMLGANRGHYISCPCICDQTKWMKGKRIANEIGALIVDFNVNSLGDISRIRIELVPCLEIKTCNYNAPDKHVKKLTAGDIWQISA